MLKLSLYLFLLVISPSFCFSQASMVNSNNKCYSEKIRLNIKDKIFKDTVVQFRNYIKNLDDKRIMCSGKFYDNKLEKLIWECKYISVYLQSQNRLNRFSIVTFKKSNKKVTIVSYYMCNRKTRETLELIRFKVVNYKITGINIFPVLFEGFTSIEEFENHKLDVIE
jgi:hypothetical protein